MKKIVVIETTDFLRIQIEKLLVNFGYDNAEVLSGLLRNSVMPTFLGADLIIMDLDNFSLDIVDLIEKIRAEHALFQIPIILLSGQSDIKTLKRAIQAGCNDFIIKPMNNDILMQKIHKALKRTSQTALQESILSKASRVEAKNIAKLTWSKSFQIGIEEIDQDHKAIIDNYQKLYDQMKLGQGHGYYREVVHFMSKYINEHFQREEAFHKRIDYDKRLEHKALHDDFKRQIDLFIEDVKDDAADNEDLIRLNLFLRNWIMHHILIEDLKVGESYLKSQ